MIIIMLIPISNTYKLRITVVFLPYGEFTGLAETRLAQNTCTCVKIAQIPLI